MRYRIIDQRCVVREALDAYHGAERDALLRALMRCMVEWWVTPEEDPTGSGVIAYSGSGPEIFAVRRSLREDDRRRIKVELEE